MAFGSLILLLFTIFIFLAISKEVIGVNKKLGTLFAVGALILSFLPFVSIKPSNESPQLNSPYYQLMKKWI